MDWLWGEGESRPAPRVLFMSQTENGAANGDMCFLTEGAWGWRQPENMSLGVVVKGSNC
jgi:hypothetical protein